MTFDLGDVVALRSSLDDGPFMTVLRVEQPEGEPPKYDLVMASHDGANLLTFCLPHFALVLINAVNQGAAA